MSDNILPFDPARDVVTVPMEKRRKEYVRLSRRHQDMARTRIKAAAIIDRMQAFALDEEITVTAGQNGGNQRVKVIMTSDQLRAAEILLRKVLPDLNRTEMKTDLNLGKRAARATELAAARIAATANGSDASTEYKELMGLGAETEVA